MLHGVSVGQDQHPLPGKDRWATKKVTREAVELSVEADGQSFAGGPLVVRITIRNSGKDKLKHVEPGIYQVFTFRVVDQDGTPVPMTRFGQKKLVGRGTGGKTRTLPPGSYYATVYNLSRLFDLTVPGSYCLRVSKGFYPHDMSQSATLKLDVKVAVREPKSEDLLPK